MLKMAIVNLAETATIIDKSSEQPGYPASNLTIAKPDQPWKTGGLDPAFAVLDYGSAKSVGALAAIGTNYTSALYAANASNSWGAPARSSPSLVLGTNPANQRTCLIYEPSDGPWTFRYNRWVPQGAPNDGSTFYRTGYLFPCVFEEFRNWAWDWADDHDQKMETTETLGGAEEDNILGPLL